MKNSSGLRAIAAVFRCISLTTTAAIVLGLAPGQTPGLHAVTLTWDANTGLAGVQEGGGTWDAVNTNWDNGGGNQAWPTLSPVNDAIFGNGSGGSGLMSVAVSLPVPNGIRNITFGNLSAGAAYQLSGAGFGFLGASGGTITVNNTNGTSEISAPIGASSLTVSGPGDLDISGQISTVGTNGVIKQGPGVLLLTNSSNFFSARVTINAGVVSVPTVANVTVNSGLGRGTASNTNLILNGGTLRYTGSGSSTNRLFSIGGSGGTFDASGSGAVDFTATGLMGGNSQVGSRTLTLTGTNPGANQIAITIPDFGGATSMNKTGVGVWTLSNAANTYTGSTTISAGTLNINADGALGSIVGGTTVGAVGALRLSAVNYSTTEPLAINGGTLEINGTSTYSGPITLLTGATSTFNVPSGQTLFLTGGVSKSGATSLITGGGTVDLSGTGYTGALPASDLVVDGATLVLHVASTYNGPTTVQNAGVIKLAASNVLPAVPATPLTLASGGSLDLNGFDEGVASLSGAGGGITNSSTATAQLRVGAGGGSGTFTGSLQDGTGGVALQKLGGGTQTLAAASTYSGGTEVVAGIVNATNGAGSATGSGDVTVDGSGTLSGTGSLVLGVNRSVLIQGGVTIGDATLGSPAPADFSIATSGAGSLTLAVTSTLTLDLFTGAGLGDNTANPLSADLLILIGDLNIASGADLVIANPNSMSAWGAGDEWHILDVSALDTVTGTFNPGDISLPVLAPSLAWDLSELFTQGDIKITPVPEPDSVVLLLGGGAALLRRRRNS